MSALREIAASFGLSFDTGPLARGDAAVSGLAGRLGQLGTSLQSMGRVLAGSALVAGVRSFAEGFEQQASLLQDTSDRLGVTTTQLQELNHAARMSGVSAETMTGALTRLSDALGNSGGAASPASRALHTLGVAARDAGGQTRSVNDVMDDVAVAMGGVSDPTRRTALAMDIFGRTGTRLTGVLTGGAQGLAAMRAEFHALGGGLSDASVRAGADFGDAMDRWNVAGDSFRALLATALLPRLTDLVTWLSHTAAALHQALDGTHVVQIAMVALAATAAYLGVALLASFAPVLAPILLIAAGIAAIVLVVDDLITFLNGGDSAIGRFLDSLLGVGASQQIVEALRDAWRAFVGDLTEGVREIEAFVDRIERLIASSDTLRSYFHDLREGLGIPAARPAATGPMPRGAVQTPAAARETADLERIQRVLMDSHAGAGAHGAAFDARVLEVAGVHGGGGATATATAPRATTTVTRTTSNANTFHITTNNPATFARQFQQLLAAHERTQNDTDHPIENRE